MVKDPQDGFQPAAGATEVALAETSLQEEFNESRFQVDLCKMKLEKVEVYIKAYIDPVCGDLVIHGQDLGPVVEEYFGKSDYEYRRTVPCQEKATALAALQAITRPERLKQLEAECEHRDQMLMQLVKEHFSSKTAISCFEEWCNAHGIVYNCHSF